MMDTKVAEIASRLVALGAGSARLMTPDAAENLLDHVAAMHVFDARARYWWSSLKNPAKTIEYGSDSAVWRHALDERMQKMGSEGGEVFLAITDDEARPWPVIAVPKDRLIPLLLELPFFEYFVFEKNCDCIVFDTHHNTLVVASRL